MKEDVKEGMKVQHTLSVKEGGRHPPGLRSTLVLLFEHELVLRYSACCGATNPANAAARCWMLAVAGHYTSSRQSSRCQHPVTPLRSRVTFERLSI